MSEPHSLHDLLTDARHSAAHVSIAFHTLDSAVVVTVGELVDRADRVARQLAARGITRGDAIAVQLTNRPEAAVIEFAAAMLGAVLTPIVPVFGVRDISAVLADSRPHAYVTERSWGKQDYLESLAKIDPELLPELVVVVGGAPGVTDWASLEQPSDTVLPAITDSADDVCLVIYTSGSTGVPKGVQHTFGSIFAEVLDYDYRPHHDSTRDHYLQGSAAGHIGGYMYPWRAIHYRMTTTVMDGWNARLACEIVTREGITAMVTTPLHVTTMLDVAESDANIDLSSIAMMMSGGAPVSPPLVRRADSNGIGLVRAYGMSEHPTVAIGDWRDPLEVRATTDGYVTGRNEIRLINDDGIDVPAGGAGEVVLRGPEQFTGYTNSPRESAFTTDGWYRTGDIGRFDAEGRLTIVDRKKNIIIRGGENLSATEIEEIVSTHPAVVEVGVIGVPDERYGEKACAFVVLREGESLTIDDLQVHFATLGAAKQKVPEHLRFVDALPRTGTGKLRKGELLELLQLP